MMCLSALIKNSKRADRRRRHREEQHKTRRLEFIDIKMEVCVSETMNPTSFD